jgi:hypothetical protein
MRQMLTDYVSTELVQQTTSFSAVNFSFNNQGLKTDTQLTPGIEIVPFITGRRPTDEIAHPGLGSSDSAAMLIEHDNSDGYQTSTNYTYILFKLKNVAHYAQEDINALALDVSLSFRGSDGTALHHTRVAGWQRRTVPLQVFASDNNTATLRAASLAEIEERHLVVAFPSTATMFTDIGIDPFSFGQLFSQILQVELRLSFRGVPVAQAQTCLDVFDTRRFGSLYKRIMERLVVSDTQVQAQQYGFSNLSSAYHPWFPVLLIGADKAALYTQALIEDIVYKKHHLTDARWLARVGIYLEFLTCMGIFEALKAEGVAALDAFLSPEEIHEWENSPFLNIIRQRLNVAGWREVWHLRKIVFPNFGFSKQRPVSMLNLLSKKKATLAFLEVHHEDLKQAIELAGSNLHNAQETWHRVFRDAERAVLRNCEAAFPELASVKAPLRKLVLWHRKAPGWLTFPGNQDGLFPSACNQYRASMNEVAQWSKKRGLTDYTGDECIPECVSLLQAAMNKQTRQFERLQRRDGHVAQPALTISHDEVYTLLSQVSLFQNLAASDLLNLVKLSRKIHLGPMERILIQGQAGSSLFIVVHGTLEVLVRQPDGSDRMVRIHERGDLFGERAALTGTPRQATVRAIEEAVVYEISKEQYSLLLKSHPRIIHQLTAQMQSFNYSK